MTNIEIGAFLTGPHNPEHEALLRLIGRFIVGPQGDEADAKPSTMNAGKEWSDPELTELGNMLVRGCSIGEIARLLRRDHREVRDKVIEVGRVCRGVCASVSKRA